MKHEHLKRLRKLIQAHVRAELALAALDHSSHTPKEELIVKLEAAAAATHLSAYIDDLSVEYPAPLGPLLPF